MPKNGPNFIHFNFLQYKNERYYSPIMFAISICMNEILYDIRKCIFISFNPVFLPSPPPSSCVEVLLAAGAAVDLAAAGGQTPLFLACEAGRLDCVRLLLTTGADRSCTAAVSLLHRTWPLIVHVRHEI